MKKAAGALKPSLSISDDNRGDLAQIWLLLATTADTKPHYTGASPMSRETAAEQLTDSTVGLELPTPLRVTEIPSTSLEDPPS